MSKTRNVTPSNFVVLLELEDTSEDEPHNAPPLFKLLSEGHKDTAAAKSWLKKHLKESVGAYQEGTIFRLANLHPPLEQRIEMVPKLTLG